MTQLYWAIPLGFSDELLRLGASTDRIISRTLSNALSSAGIVLREFKAFRMSSSVKKKRKQYAGSKKRSQDVRIEPSQSTRNSTRSHEKREAKRLKNKNSPKQQHATSNSLCPNICVVTPTINFDTAEVRRWAAALVAQNEQLTELATLVQGLLGIASDLQPCRSNSPRSQETANTAPASPQLPYTPRAVTSPQGVQSNHISVPQHTTPPRANTQPSSPFRIQNETILPHDQVPPRRLPVVPPLSLKCLGAPSHSSPRSYSMRVATTVVRPLTERTRPTDAVPSLGSSRTLIPISTSAPESSRLLYTAVEPLPSGASSNRPSNRPGRSGGTLCPPEFLNRVSDAPILQASVHHYPSSYATVPNDGKLYLHGAHPAHLENLSTVAKSRPTEGVLVAAVAGTPRIYVRAQLMGERRATAIGQPPCKQTERPVEILPEQIFKPLQDKNKHPSYSKGRIEIRQRDYQIKTPDPLTATRPTPDPFTPPLNHSSLAATQTQMSNQRYRSPYQTQSTFPRQISITKNTSLQAQYSFGSAFHTPPVVLENLQLGTEHPGVVRSQNASESSSDYLQQSISDFAIRKSSRPSHNNVPHTQQPGTQTDVSVAAGSPSPSRKVKWRNPRRSTQSPANTPKPSFSLTPNRRTTEGHHRPLIGDTRHGIVPTMDRMMPQWKHPNGHPVETNSTNIPNNGTSRITFVDFQSQIGQPSHPLPSRFSLAPHPYGIKRIRATPGYTALSQNKDTTGTVGVNFKKGFLHEAEWCVMAPRVDPTGNESHSKDLVGLSERGPNQIFAIQRPSLLPATGRGMSANRSSELLRTHRVTREAIGEREPPWTLMGDYKGLGSKISPVNNSHAVEQARFCGPKLPHSAPADSTRKTGHTSSCDRGHQSGVLSAQRRRKHSTKNSSERSRHRSRIIDMRREKSDLN